MPFASVTVTGLDVETVVALTDSVTGGTIDTETDPDVPPPGAGFVTETCAELPVIAEAGTVA